MGEKEKRKKKIDDEYICVSKLIELLKLEYDQNNASTV